MNTAIGITILFVIAVVTGIFQQSPFITIMILLGVATSTSAKKHEN